MDHSDRRNFLRYAAGTAAAPLLKRLAPAAVTFGAVSMAAKPANAVVDWILVLGQLVWSGFKLYQMSQPNPDADNLSAISRNVSVIADMQAQIIENLAKAGITLREELLHGFRDNDMGKFRALAQEFARVDRSGVPDREWINAMAEEIDRFTAKLGEYDVGVFPAYTAATAMQMTVHAMRKSAPGQIVEILKQKQAPLERWQKVGDPSAIPALVEAAKKNLAPLEDILAEAKKGFLVNRYVVNSRPEGATVTSINSYGQFARMTGVSKTGKPLIEYKKEWIDPFNVPGKPESGVDSDFYFSRDNGVMFYASPPGIMGRSSCETTGTSFYEDRRGSDLSADHLRAKKPCVERYLEGVIKEHAARKADFDTVTAIAEGIKVMQTQSAGLTARMESLTKAGYGRMPLVRCPGGVKGGPSQQCIPERG